MNASHLSRGYNWSHRTLENTRPGATTLYHTGDTKTVTYQCPSIYCYENPASGIDQRYSYKIDRLSVTKKQREGRTATNGKHEFHQLLTTQKPGKRTASKIKIGVGRQSGSRHIPQPHGAK
ncbi:hypothetical protein E2C01_031849 [Portunus trituberculatus]|uniref:Uncharacterized protein n=1 Tax=Portunus trituberculatus TaxID=210409 RepID=A0A5B7EZQ5_PORTR|nr:hypothetical protein [Portunus trituberculatus]